MLYYISMDRLEVFDWIATGNPRDRRESFEALKLELGLDSGRQMTSTERVEMVRNAIGLAYLKHYINLRTQDPDSENQTTIRDRELTIEGLSKIGLLAVVIPSVGIEGDETYVTEHEYGILGEWASSSSEESITRNSLSMLWNDLRKQYRNFVRYREKMSINPTIDNVESYLRERHWEGLFDFEGLISLAKFIPVIEGIASTSTETIRDGSLRAGLIIANCMKGAN